MNARDYHIERLPADRLSLFSSAKTIPMTIGKFLIFLGLAMALMGIIIGYAPWLLQWFGKLPGDIRIENEKHFIYIPFTSMLIVSVLLTLIINLFFRR